jgi:hypothetical protein
MSESFLDALQFLHACSGVVQTTITSCPIIHRTFLFSHRIRRQVTSVVNPFSAKPLSCVYAKKPGDICWIYSTVEKILYPLNFQGILLTFSLNVKNALRSLKMYKNYNKRN